MTSTPTNISAACPRLPRGAPDAPPALAMGIPDAPPAPARRARRVDLAPKSALHRRLYLQWRRYHCPPAREREQAAAAQALRPRTAAHRRTAATQGSLNRRAARPCRCCCRCCCCGGGGGACCRHLVPVATARARPSRSAEIGSGRSRSDSRCCTLRTSGTNRPPPSALRANFRGHRSRGSSGRDRTRGARRCHWRRCLTARDRIVGGAAG